MNQHPYSFKLKAHSPDGEKHFDSVCYCTCGSESADWRKHSSACDVFYFKAKLLPVKDKPAMRYAD